ncbi:MAG: Na/Pi cotransporter family protein, partial [Oscillospiraceae bacterium]|nr:Na/Pi cotransporter family protein [Oscillospiraceae bacterium]
MSIFNIITFAGGLALFLYGMHIMGESLEKKAGGRFKKMLEQITSNPLSGVLLGFGITAVIQSSSATTVMTVGLVNSGILDLNNAVGVIMGANIGTTVTAWILSLVGIQSTNYVVQMFKPSSFSPILAVIGICLITFFKSERKKDVGHILLGFGILMFGMETMSATVKPLAAVPEFVKILTMFKAPVLGILAGAAVTGVIQSSSASVGILQAMSVTGNITFGMAIPIVMGQNIGTCVTALLSSAGANANAKRAALVHLYFNVVGVIIFSALFYLINAFIGWPFLNSTINALQVAVFHSIFNVFTTLILLPLRNRLVWLASRSVRGRETEERFRLLDERLLSTPTFAVARCRDLTVNMAELARENFRDSLKTLSEYSDAAAVKILENEEMMDRYEDKLGTYMVKLSAKSISASDSKELGVLLQCIGDFERIADHSVNIMQTADELREKDIGFSEEAEEDLKIMLGAVSEIVDLAVKAFTKNDLESALMVEPLEEVVDVLKVRMRSRHIVRLQRTDCT